jgi:hypothetical protein
MPTKALGCGAGMIRAKAVLDKEGGSAFEAAGHAESASTRLRYSLRRLFRDWRGRPTGRSRPFRASSCRGSRRSPAS